MSRIGWGSIALAGVIGAVWLPARADQSAKPSPVASVAELAKEAESSMERLGEYLGSPESYTSAQEERVPQAAGLLACVAEALVEHPDRKKSKIAAVALRNAAVHLAESDSFKTATAAYKAAKQAMTGQPAGTVHKTTGWKNLVSMDVSMKVMESRSNRLRRGLRRFRHPQRDSRHAVALVLLGRAMRAGTDDLDSPKEIAQWKKFSDDYLSATTALAIAMRNKDKAGAKKQHVRIMKSCKDCHDVFRDN